MARKRIHELTNTATEANLSENDYAVVDSVANGTRKTLLSSLTAYIHGKWAAFINALTAVTSFSSGDNVVMVNGTTAKKMSKDTLLELTAQNALGSIKSLATTKYKGFMALDDADGTGKMDVGTIFNDFAPEFVPSDKPNPTTTIAGLPYMYSGSLYVAKEDYQGPWDGSKFTRIYLSDMLNCVGAVTCPLIGNENAAQIAGIRVTGGDVLRIFPSSTNWDVTGVNLNLNRLVIRYITNTGSTVDLKTYLVTDSVPSMIVVNVPINATRLELYFRAAIGTKVSFIVQSYSSVSAESIVDAYYYEIGNIAMTSSELVYSSSTTRLRTKRNGLIKAKKGDMIGVNAGFQIYVAISSDGNAPYEIHGWITNWTFTSDCYVAVLVRKGIGGDQVTTLEELLSNTWVRSLNSELSPFVNAYNAFNESRNSVKGGAFAFQLNGADANLVYKRIKANKGDVLQIKLSKTSWATSASTPGEYKVVGIRKVLEGETTQDIIYAEKQDAYWPSQFEVIVPDDAEYIDVYLRAAVGESVAFIIEAQTNNGFILNPKSSIIKSVNHRGFNSIAPENTLPAFRLSAKYGFGIVETDVRVSSDGYLVCIHDGTVDRTSDGTGNVADKTLAELKALDFGSWKSADYAGTTIPTYKEFLACCKRLGLQAYVEVKTLSAVAKVVQETKDLGMIDNVTFISDNSYGILESVAAIATKSRFGLIVNDVTAGAITTAQSIKTDYNEVFFDANYERLTAEGLALAIENGFGVEAYTIDNIQSLATLDDCISGITSNNIVASQVIYIKELNGN